MEGYDLRMLRVHSDQSSKWFTPTLLAVGRLDISPNSAMADNVIFCLDRQNDDIIGRVHVAEQVLNGSHLALFYHHKDDRTRIHRETTTAKVLGPGTPLIQWSDISTCAGLSGSSVWTIVGGKVAFVGLHIYNNGRQSGFLYDACKFRKLEGAYFVQECEGGCMGGTLIRACLL